MFALCLLLVFTNWEKYIPEEDDNTVSVINEDGIKIKYARRTYNGFCYKTDHNEQFKIAILGTSMTQQWAPELNCLTNIDVRVESFSKGGVTVAFEKDILTYKDLFVEAKEIEPDLILIDLGSNDSKRA